MSQASPAPVAPAAAERGQMTHRQILEALSGLLLAMFVAMLSSTVVTNALPRIVTDLHGSQTGYTWVVVATMLAMTATTPIWGKLADLFSKKLLVQLALVIYIGRLAGRGVRAEHGGADRRPRRAGPRRRRPDRAGPGRHRDDGLAARARPLLRLPRRGVRARHGRAARSSAAWSSTRPLGWRGCFFVGLPFAVVAFFLLQKTLHLPVVKRAGRTSTTSAPP